MSATAIEPLYEAFYIEAMLFNTTSALLSCQRVSEYVRSLEQQSDNSKVQSEWEDVLDSLQNLVTRAAALSRYFWPARDGKAFEHKLRGERLCQAFSVTDGSTLSNRDLRNGMEHFDEKLDRYLSRGIVGHILPSYVGPSPSSREVPLHLFRGYFIDTGVFEILGEQYKIQPIADEVLRIHRILEQCAEHGGRLPKGGAHP